DMAKCHGVLFDVAASRSEKMAALSDWLGENQPCLFGRMEAKRNRLAFCLLTENDMERSDEDIRAKIQRERIDWKRMALGADSHGFLIVAVSEAIPTARPRPALHGLGQRHRSLDLGG